jgi:hypothetical protein
VAENILLWGFYCAAGGSVLLFCSIIQNLVSPWSSSPRNAKNNPTVGRIGTSDNGAFRGYDSPELFEEDLILRIEQLQSKIANYNRNRTGRSGPTL